MTPTSSRSSAHGIPLGRHASRALFVAGFVYVVGSLVDLGILWFMQRQPGMQWEFVALTNTADAIPRLILAIALLYAAAALGGGVAPIFARIFSAGLLLLGLAAAALGAMMVLNYLSVAGPASDGSQMLRAAAFKTLALCTLYVVLLVPAGVSGFRNLKAS